MSCKVSIIVPVYNVEAYLEECLQSILHQTLSEIEVICVNDGSTDQSLSILERYAREDSRMKIIAQENRGYGVAMNRGLDAASGEYIGIVEPDDFISLNMYENLYRAAVEYDLEIVKEDYYRFRTEQQGTCRYYIALSGYAEDYRRVLGKDDRKRIFEFAMNTWTGIYRSDFLKAHQIRHHETPGASYQDTGFWFQTMMHVRRMMILDEIGYWCRRDNVNSSVNNRGKVYAINREYDFIRGLLLQEGTEWEELKGIYWRKRYQSYEWTLQRIDPSYTEEYLRSVAQELTDAWKQGEFSERDFLSNEWPNVRSMMEGKYVSVTDAQGMVRLLLNSRSYQLGRAMTYIPRKMRGILSAPREKK